MLSEQPSWAGILYWTKISQVEIGNVRLAAIIGSTMVTSYLEVESLQLTCRSDTCKFHLHVPDLQTCLRDLSYNRLPG